MDVSFIIPAYNEAARIGASLAKGIAWFERSSWSQWEIIVVDDGSTDSTVDVARGCGDERVRVLCQDKNRGKGAAVRRGMLEADGAYRVFSDADFSTPIEETTRGLDLLAEHDIAIGSRAIDRSYVQVHQPWYRETMGKFFNLLVQLIAVPGVKDTQCGFKCFRAHAAEEVFSRVRIDGFSFDVEALYIARKLGLSIIEFPVHWYNDERSTLHPVKDSIKMFRELLRIRSLHRGEF